MACPAREANTQRALACPLRLDAVPQGIGVEELARLGREGGGLDDATLPPAKPDPRNTPGLYEPGPRTLRDQMDRQK